MHRAIGYLSKRCVQLRPREGPKVFLTFLYFFLVITAYYIIKPVSRSLVLGELGSRLVPYMDLICAALMGPIVTLFAKLVDRMSKPRLVSGSFWVVIGVLMAFWWLLGWQHPWVAGAFYVWVAIFSVLVVTLFWLVANDLYHPREARRLFGFIGSGGILGGIVGSSVAAIGAQLIGTQHLLLLSSAVLVICWLLVRRLWAFAPERVLAEEARATPRSRETFLTDLRGFANTVLQSRYLLLLITIVGLNKLVATLIYYQLNPFIEQAFPQQDERTTFAGMFFGGLNIAAFLVQFLLTSWVLRRWGLLVGLLVLPVGVLAGTTGLLVLPVLWLAALTELYDGSLNYSLQQTTKEVLYLPIDRSIRYKVKPFIDMVVFRFGKGVAAILGIVLLDVFGIHPRFLSWVAIPLIVAWIAAALQVRGEYVATIRTMLQARALSRRPPDARQASGEAGPLSGDGGAQPFGSLTDGQSLTDKLGWLNRLLTAGRGALPPQAQALVAELTDYEAVLADRARLPEDPRQLQATIGNPREPMARRRASVRLLARPATQEAVDHLVGLMLMEADTLLRREATIGLVTLRLHGRPLQFPLQPIGRQIAREVSGYDQIRRVARIYRQHSRGASPSADPALQLLRGLGDEAEEQIFRLLMLLYRPEDIHLIYEQWRATEPYVRADAIELLDNLVDPAIRSVIFPILDEDQPRSEADSTEADGRDPAVTYQVLRGAIWDHNCWLSVTTLWIVGQFRLAALRQELERASCENLPVLSTAAKLALSLAERR